MFRGGDVFKPVSGLSGGERARLAFAILALDGANFLLLDEPTNHLDIPAREALQQVLENYSGTILLVSHDRYLIDRLATQIWELRDGRLCVFKGSYREFLLRQAVPAYKLPGRTRCCCRRNRCRRAKTTAKTNAMPKRWPCSKSRIQEQEITIQRELSAELQKSRCIEQQPGLRTPLPKRLSSQVAQAQANLDGLMAEWEKIAA